MSKATDKREQRAAAAEEPVSNKILTVPNVISAIRLCMIPVFLVLLIEGYDILATFIFALAAGTDWIDGQIARRTHTVSKLGQLLDPAVDRLLMISGVLGLLLVGRLPLWIIVVVLLRDGLLLVGGAILLSKYRIRVAVIYAGKVTTTLLFVGFAGLLLNWPLIAGLNVIDVSWLPGFNGVDVSWGIWFVYAGLVLGIITTGYYIAAALKELKAARSKESS
ncbi:CDP-alcohol phosphatidyltransferase family protein [Raoultibacter massiliensis]|uniref:CDP-alcohol phosphatidyltransferase family protein n=1 Tax=Raoultibacter massiliensis TaxID=1852371 RepID=A0ABV1JAU2_9ACTN|nr:CDP-alcohol phosphatidyltransferase family protein [Raoultibacter massiliensis]